MSQEAQSSILERNKQIVRNFAEDVLNRHDLAAVDKYIPGAEGLKQYLGEYFAGHPDSSTTIDQIVAEGDKVFVLFIGTATNKQTGKKVTIKSADVYRIVNGMFVEHWDVVEASTFPNRRISEL
ncbi:MAG: nuclear transport factor 2 family protein [Nitrososphaerales archaeon]